MPMMISEFWIRGNILEYIVVDEKVSTGEKKNVKIYVNCYSREKKYVCVCGDQTDGSNDHPSNEMRWDKKCFMIFWCCSFIADNRDSHTKITVDKINGIRSKEEGWGRYKLSWGDSHR